MSQNDAKAYLAALPHVEAGEAGEAFFPGESSCLTVYHGCTASDFEAYLARLTANGFTGGEDYALEANRYALRYGKDATVYLSYTAATESLRVYAEAAGAYAYPGAVSDDRPNICTPMLWQLPVDVRDSQQNGGMTYVLRTPKGSFVVIDGGYAYEAEADTVYRCLKANTPAGVKTEIEGWWITHLHWDHFGGLLNFSEKYAAEIPVKNFYFHTDYRWMDPSVSVHLPNAMSRWPGAGQYTKMHTGMTVMQGGLPFRVLFTLEDLYPMLAGENYDFNSTSTVFSIDVGGQRLMILGDVMLEACERIMSDIPHGSLKSDLVQYSHHGYEGGTRELYDAIAAPTVLWPMNVAGYQPNYAEVPQNVFGIWHKMTKCGKNYPLQNNYICYEAEYVREILLPSEERGLSLPHTPQGVRLPDHEAIFRAETANDAKGE